MIENQNLRRQVEELQAAARARAEEQSCIIQQALEERTSADARISNSLYRRIKRHAPSVFGELPHVIDRFGNVTLSTPRSSSVSSLDPRSGSSSSSHLSDCLKRDAQIIDGSNDSPSKRQCSEKSSVDIPSEVTTSVPQRLIPTPNPRSQYVHTRLDATHGQNPVAQHRHGSHLAPTMSAQLPSEGSDFRETQETTMPSRVSTTFSTPWMAHVPPNCQQGSFSVAEHRPKSPLLEGWESSNWTNQQQQNTTTEDPALYDMDFSGSHVLDEIFNPQGPGAWDESAVAVADWLYAPTHSGGC